VRRPLAVLATTVLLISVHVSSQPARSAGPPYSPEDALGTFQIADGFRIEIFASEPLVTSPVAMEVDEQGRMFVVEMPGYPLDTSGSGRVVVLNDSNGDGRPDRRTVFAEGLRLPTGIMKWKKGVLVTDSPQVWYLEDSDGDGRADVKREVLTGFALSNPQHTTNTPVYGLDNWIYLANEGPVRTVRYRDIFGDAGGEVRFPDRPDGPRLPPDGDGRNVRFKPDTYQLEMLSGRSQFGQTFDAWGHHFDVSNSRPMFHEVLAARYATRNPALIVPSVIEQVPDYRQPAEVFPITNNPEYQLLTDVGTMTSASGLTWYLADLFPAAYRTTAFVAEGAHNIVHALSVREHGVTFRGSRMVEGREFLASTDAWSRPVNFYLGPDGALYVLDYYRKILEHPEWLDYETAKSPDLQAGRDRGRIYRIVPSATRPLGATAAAAPATRANRPASARGRRTSRTRKPSPAPAPARVTLASNGSAPWLDRLSLGEATTAELVRTLGHPNIWWRRHAQRLLVDRRQAEAALPLAQAVTSGPAIGRAHALWTLQGMRRLTTTVIERALADPTPGVRENAIKLAELHVPLVPTLTPSLLKLSGDPDPKVRFQLLLTLGAINSREAAAIRQRMLLEYVDDDWMQIAGLSAARLDAAALFKTARDEAAGAESPGRRMLFNRIGSMAAAAPRLDQVRDVMRSVAVDRGPQDDWWRAAAIEGVAAGLKGDRRKSPELDADRASMLDLLRRSQSLVMRRAALQFFEVAGLPKSPELAAAAAEAARVAADASHDGDVRADAIRLLRLVDPAQYAEVFKAVLGRAEPTPVHTAALRAVGDVPGDAAATLFVGLWDRWTPAVREEAIRQAVREPGRVKILLDAIDAGTIKVSEIAWPTRVRMMMSDDEGLRARARQHFSTMGRDPSESLARYRDALATHGDAERGRQVFARVCAACHQYRGDAGTAFGPDLGEVRSHLPGSLLADILRPNQSIADGYELWLAQLTDGSTVTGIIASETPSSVTFRRMGGGTTAVSRSQISSMRVAEVSAMPEGLDAQIDVAQMADLIAFIRGAR
jgi:putative membrane-bound dehydrogenase-like protein